MIIPEIGECAGKIWLLLHEKGSMSVEELKKQTNLEEACVLLGLGWLARENKIQFSFKNNQLFAELNHYHEHYF